MKGKHGHTVTDEQKATFLREWARTSNVRLASREAGVSEAWGYNFQKLIKADPSLLQEAMREVETQRAR